MKGYLSSTCNWLSVAGRVKLSVVGHVRLSVVGHVKLSVVGHVKLSFSNIICRCKRFSQVLFVADSLYWNIMSNVISLELYQKTR